MKDSSKEIRFGKFFHFDNDFWGEPLRLGMLDLYQIGELCCERGFKVESHEQSVYEVTYVISGSGFSYTDGECVPLSEGDVLINSMGHQHAMEAGKSDIFRYAYIGFRFNSGAGDDVAELQRVYDERPWRLSKDQGNLLFPFMQCIDEFYSQTLHSRRMIKNYCEQIVVMAVRKSSAEKTAVSHVVQRPRNESSAVYSIIRYVEENVYRIGTIQNMAQDLGYSYTYLSHLFRERTGTTIQNYIHYKKIERSVQLLRYGGLTATQVAAMLNYESVQTFSKSFRRIMGVTPTQYVRQGLNDGESGQTLPSDPLNNEIFREA